MRISDWICGERRGLLVACALIVFGSCASRAAAQLTVGFAAGDIYANTSTFTVTVWLSAASPDVVTVQYATEDGVNPNGAPIPGRLHSNVWNVDIPRGYNFTSLYDFRRSGSRGG